MDTLQCPSLVRPVLALLDGNLIFRIQCVQHISIGSRFRDPVEGIVSNFTCYDSIDGPIILCGPLLGTNQDELTLRMSNERFT